MITASATTAITSKRCAIGSTHWADDTHAIASGIAQAISETGAKSWYFLTVDIAFGGAMQQAATQVIEAHGGKVLGSVTFPINSADFSSLLLQAQASGAEKIGLVSVGGDLDNQIKQGAEFGIGRNGKQALVGFLVYLQDVNAVGLKVAQGLELTTGFYWDQDDESRAFAKRFFAEAHQMPSRNHAAIYTAVKHYLEAVKAAGSDEAAAVGKAMRAAPIDFFGHPAKMRGDGRVLYDLTLYRVKTPAESKAPWDDYAKLRDIAAVSAFAPENTALCEK
jgi:branched-chain amino acid transport system substrate-binding protein